MAELGNVTPVIVVPGDWQETDFDYQADNILSMLGTFNGYACTAARILVLPKSWAGSEKLIKLISTKMAEAKAAVNYYPGTNETIKEALAYYPQIDKRGVMDAEHQPWMLVTGLKSDEPEYAFRREFWSSFMAQVYVDAATTEEYLQKSVTFVNEKLWGTLSAVIIIDKKTQEEMSEKNVLENAIDQLHYGTVSLNVYPAFGLIMKAPWGGYPGSTYNDIQSGNCFVSNPLMLNNIEKSVIYAPFHISPRPLWFLTGNNNTKAFNAFARFAMSNKLMDFLRVLKGTFLG